MGLEDCRAKLPINDLWGALGLSGAEKVQAVEAGKEVKIRSPFREDNNPSFSVYIEGGKGKWKDHGTGEQGDEVTAIEMSRGVDTKEAIRIYHELAGVQYGNADGGQSGAKKPDYLTRKRAEKKEVKPVEEEEKAVSAAAAILGVGADGKFQGERKKSSGGGGGARGPLGDPVAVYQYQDARGKLAHETLRFEPKTFRQRRPAVPGDDPAKVKEDSDGKRWVWSLKDSPVYPYRLPELKKWPMCEPVFLVEGEKDVENLERVGEVLGTSLPMGAGKWREEFGPYFKGRWVVIVVDDDAAGREGAVKVADELLKVADRVGVLQISDVWKNAPEGADLSDWLEWGWEIGAVIEDQREMLWKAIEKVDLKDERPYRGVVQPGERGGLIVLEDRLARNLVKAESLMFCGDGFWQWKPGLGKWEKRREKTWIDRKVRRAFSSLPSGESVITKARVSSVVGLARSERVFFPEELNRYPHGMLPVRNGLLDAESGRLYPHRTGHLTTVQTPHNYERGAQCPEWLAWLEDRQEDEATRMQIQEMFGYCLFPHVNYHSFFFLYGEGGTGKSTCVDVLEWLIGEENKVSIELTELDNPFLRSQLVGKSLYLAKELTARSFKHIGLIKAMVSGDPISVDVKYGDGFDFRPKGRLVMESNVQAMTPDSSGGFERRFIQIGFDKMIDRTKMEYGFQDRFKAEMPGILNWAIEGFLRLRERGRFEHTERSQEATNDLLKHRAQVPSFLGSGWIEEETEENKEHGEAWMSEIHKLYLEWCEENDVVAFFTEKQTFAREMFSKKKAWRERKRRRNRGGERDFLLVGLRLMRKSIDQEFEEQDAENAE